MISAAYRRLSLLHHPDRGGCSTVMQALNAAKENLGKHCARADPVVSAPR